MNELKGYLEEDRRVCICRELTKAYESIEHTTIGNVNGEKLVLKGEYTLVVEGKREYSDRHPKPASVVDEKAMKCMDVLRAEGVSRRVIQRVMKEVFDVGMVGDLDLAVGIGGKEGLVSIIVCLFSQNTRIVNHALGYSGTRRFPTKRLYKLKREFCNSSRSLGGN